MNWQKGCERFTPLHMRCGDSLASWRSLWTRCFWSIKVPLRFFLSFSNLEVAIFMGIPPRIYQDFLVTESRKTCIPIFSIITLYVLVIIKSDDYRWSSWKKPSWKICGILWKLTTKWAKKREYSHFSAIEFQKFQASEFGLRKIV